MRSELVPEPCGICSPSYTLTRKEYLKLFALLCIFILLSCTYPFMHSTLIMGSLPLQEDFPGISPGIFWLKYSIKLFACKQSVYKNRYKGLILVAKKQVQKKTHPPWCRIHCLHCLKTPVWTHIHTSCFNSGHPSVQKWLKHLYHMKVKFLTSYFNILYLFNNLSLNMVEQKELIFSARINHLIRTKSQWINTWCHGCYGKHSLYASSFVQKQRIQDLKFGLPSNICETANCPGALWAWQQ